jgi:hypothetical protein
MHQVVIPNFSTKKMMRRSDNLAYFSSRGPTYDDFRFKPDVVCPGHSIVSAMAEKWRSCKLVHMEGTSMATPLCAGAAALGA